MLDRRLLHHLVTWLGQWPAGRPLTVVGSSRRAEPGWDGQIHPAIGVGGPGGRVLSVAPPQTTAVRRLVEERPEQFLDALPATIGLPERIAYEGVFRWTIRPNPLPDAGQWLPADDPAVPEWLRPFGGTCSSPATRTTGVYLAGVGIKRHDQFGHEIGRRHGPGGPGQGAGPAAGGPGRPTGARRGRGADLPARPEQHRLLPGGRGGRPAGPRLDLHGPGRRAGLTRQGRASGTITPASPSGRRAAPGSAGPAP